ncbi:hypothetical protein [Rhizobium sp. AG855]|uniref:hypothetical protein n=1 Tax=Rhizobium sp. AG855 TaxID=2183898 RepID=UPI000E7269AE|nr:hypothetical protein [Rhizobium sp. AG855]RKE83654.1 hypothetical protein DFO46_0407 [Rhizobium sp. AG855]
MKVPKLHLSRKLVLIVGGVLVLCGGTGGAAVYIGADTLLGPSYAELNGLECTEVQTVEIHKKDRFWIRKYVTTNETADGLIRIKTALRVAKVVQETKKADLVQVVVLDLNGPKERGQMRGRAVGADVIFVPDPHRVPEAATARMLTARYADGPAAANGEFFGQRVDMMEGDIQALLAKLDDSADCVTPEVVVPEGEGHGDAHGKKTDSHGKKSDGHGDGGHGEAAADGHGEAPAGEHGAETPVAEHGGGESKGWMASLMGMVGLGGDEAPAEGHGAADAGHGEAPAEGHGDPAAAGHGDGGGEGHAAPAEDSAALPEGEHSTEGAAPGDANSEHAPAPADAAAVGHEAPAHDASAPAEAPAGDAASHGDTASHGDAAAVPAESGHAETAGHGASTEGAQASAPAAHEAEVPVEEVPVEEPQAHDGAAADAPAHEAASAEAPTEDAGWFSSLKSMVGLGGDEAVAPADPGGDAAAPAETPAASGAASADHGAAWLEKMRSQPIEPVGDAAAPGTAPEEHGAAADHAPAAGSADAGHAVKGHAAPNEDETKLPPKKIIPAEEAKAGH